MNQEYLWSKKGNDPDVERLEGLLRDFRFDGKSAPELPSTNMVSVAKGPKRRFVLGISFVTAAAALVLMAIWITTGPVAPVAKVEQDTASDEVTAVLKNDNVREGRLTDSATDFVPKSEPLSLMTPTAGPPRSKPHRPARGPKAVKTKLTREEKYAYDRLMFALSIAGSKLRVVQDTIDRKGDAVPQSIRNEK